MDLNAQPPTQQAAQQRSSAAIGAAEQRCSSTQTKTNKSAQTSIS